MPRSGWLAMGAVVAALAATQPWVGRAWLAQPIAWGVAGVSWLAIFGAWRSRRRNPRGLTGLSWLAPVLIVGAGSLLIGARLTAWPLPAPSGPIELPTGRGPWTASVESIGSPRGGLQVATVALAEPVHLRAAITAPAYPGMTVGAVVRLGGSFEAIPDDDYGHFLGESGVDATLRARSLEIADVPSSPSAVVDRLRRSAADGLSLALPEPEAGLAAGILIGLRDRVDRDLAKAFTASGVSHVVAISGWNIAIVAATLGALLRGWSRRRRSLASLLVIAVYTVLTGASPSVMRAAIMATSVTLARESGRSGGAAAALGWAATAMIAADPAVVGDPGFQLSSLATAGLIAWATPLTERLAAWRGGRLPGWLAESLGVSLAAQAATLPLVLLAFGRLAILAPLVNLAVVPLIPAAMATGTVALIAGGSALAGLPPELATIASLPGWAFLTAIVWIVRIASSLPFASVVLEPPANVAAAAIAVGLLILISSSRARDLVRRALAKVAVRWTGPGANRPTRRAVLPGPGTRTSTLSLPALSLPRLGLPRLQLPRLPDIRRADRATRLVAIAVAASVLGLVLVGAHRADRQVRVEVLDVGQGDAILVEGDRGSRMLIDGGPDPGRLLSVLDARLPPWDRRIDLLILSHPHEDHVAGLPKLLERYRVRAIAEPGMIGPGPGYRAFASWLFGHERTIQRLATGDSLALDSIRFEVLWPDPGAVPVTPANSGTGINNVSIVLLGRIGNQRMLLMGDVEEGIDPILIGRGLPQVDLLKVAHHGSRTASTDAFLDVVRPKVAVVSAGLKNPYGHPAPATVGRLEARLAAIYRTDRNGTVDVTLEGGRWVAHPEKATAAATIEATPAIAAGARNDAAALLFRCGIPRPTIGSGVAADEAATPASANLPTIPRPTAPSGAKLIAAAPVSHDGPAASSPGRSWPDPVPSYPDRPLRVVSGRARWPESRRWRRYRRRHQGGEATWALRTIERQALTQGRPRGP